MSAYRIGLLPENDRTNGWAAHLPPRVPRPRLTGDVRADWLVIGAGWAGLAAARRLARNRPSDRVVIIDAAAVADGASGRNSGFAIDLPHTSGGSADENKGALGHMRLSRAGIAHLKEQIEAHGIDCDWREKGKYHAAVTERGSAQYPRALRRGAGAARRAVRVGRGARAPGDARNGPFHSRRPHARRSADESGRACARARGLPPRERRSPRAHPGAVRRVRERHAGRDSRRDDSGAAVHSRRERVRARLRGVRAAGPADAGVREPEPPPHRRRAGGLGRRRRTGG